MRVEIIARVTDTGVEGESREHVLGRITGGEFQDVVDELTVLLDSVNHDTWSDVLIDLGWR